MNRNYFIADKCSDLSLLTQIITKNITNFNQIILFINCYPILSLEKLYCIRFCYVKFGCPHCSTVLQKANCKRYQP